MTDRIAISRDDLAGCLTSFNAMFRPDGESPQHGMVHEPDDFAKALFAHLDSQRADRGEHYVRSGSTSRACMSRDELARAIQASLEKSKFLVDVNKATHRGDGTASARLANAAGDAQVIAADILGGDLEVAAEAGGARVTKAALAEALKDFTVWIRAEGPGLQTRRGAVLYPEAAAEGLMLALGGDTRSADPGEGAGPDPDPDPDGTSITVAELADALRGRRFVVDRHDDMSKCAQLHNPDDVAESVLRNIAASREGRGGLPKVNPGNAVKEAEDRIRAALSWLSLGNASEIIGRLYGEVHDPAACIVCGQGASEHTVTNPVTSLPGYEPDEPDTTAREFRAMEQIGRILAQFSDIQRDAVLASVTAWAKRLPPF